MTHARLLALAQNLRELGSEGTLCLRSHGRLCMPPPAPGQHTRHAPPHTPQLLGHAQDKTATRHARTARMRSRKASFSRWKSSVGSCTVKVRPPRRVLVSCTDTTSTRSRELLLARRAGNALGTATQSTRGKGSPAPTPPQPARPPRTCAVPSSVSGLSASKHIGKPQSIQSSDHDSSDVTEAMVLDGRPLEHGRQPAVGDRRALEPPAGCFDDPAAGQQAAASLQMRRWRITARTHSLSRLSLSDLCTGSAICTSPGAGALTGRSRS
jgi:hypothetical protein